MTRIVAQATGAKQAARAVTPRDHCVAVYFFGNGSTEMTTASV